MVAAHFLDVEFIKDKHQAHEEGEFKQVLRAIAKTPGNIFSSNEMLVQWASLQTALKALTLTLALTLTPLRSDPMA